MRASQWTTSIGTDSFGMSQVSLQINFVLIFQEDHEYLIKFDVSAIAENLLLTSGKVPVQNKNDRESMIDWWSILFDFSYGETTVESYFVACCLISFILQVLSWLWPEILVGLLLKSAVIDCVNQAVIYYYFHCQQFPLPNRQQTANERKR